MKNFPSVGVQIPTVHLPKPGTDLTKWAVIACDQFTSEPEYWQQVETIVGEAPSTLRLTLPEVYLGTAAEPERIRSTQAAMQRYRTENLLASYEGIILVERTTGGRTRHGIMLALDLEHYDYNKGSSSLIRATEGTILDRLPPRMRIREGATLELPHILVLIDDPQRTVIEPLIAMREQMQPLYDFDLMLGSGHLRGDLLTDEAAQVRVIAALEALAQPGRFSQHYGVSADNGVLLFAMGDGNHSLATAKAIWEKMKSTVGMDHPARYALVEIENVHDEGLEFEPIHRVLFEVNRDVQSALQACFGNKYSLQPAASLDDMLRAVNAPGSDQRIGMVTADGFNVITISNASSNLAVGTLQAFLDDFMHSGAASRIDYVHGADVVARLGAQQGNVGFYLPGMQKGDLFKTVILDGALPRKTFSMGEARDKRFYMESRSII